MKKASDVLNKQSSFSQWYSEASITDGIIFKKEDEEKNERLKLLHEIIHLPTNIGLDMPLTELLGLGEDSGLLIAGKPIHEAQLGIRLVPKRENDQLFRTRGKKLIDIIEWINSLGIDAENYTANVLPHVDLPDFSTIFIISENGVKGEAIQGAPHLLTQGLYDDLKPITFQFDFAELKVSSADANVVAHIKEIISNLKLTGYQAEQLTSGKVTVNIINGYLAGYFETVTSHEYGLWFIDFNRYLGEKLDDIIVGDSPEGPIAPFLKGLPVSKGKATGKVVLVSEENIDDCGLAPGDILACKMTTPSYISLMKIAGAILTQQGGILSHAAIISRELGKPCIAAIQGLLAADVDGKLVAVNADAGTVVLLSES